MSKVDSEDIQKRITDLSSDLYDFSAATDEPLIMIALAARLLADVTEAAANIELSAEQRAEFQGMLRSVDDWAQRSVAAAREEMGNMPATERDPRALDPKLN